MNGWDETGNTCLPEFPPGQISILFNEISVGIPLWSANELLEKYGRRLPGGILTIYPPPPTVSDPTTRLDSGDTLQGSCLAQSQRSLPATFCIHHGTSDRVECSIDQ